MKLNLFTPRKDHRRGFSLVEATLSIGILSFGFLALAPLLAFGLKTARQARDNRTASQIAQNLIEQAKQGTLVAGTNYLDSDGAACTSAQAVYAAQTTLGALTSGGSTSGNGSPNQLTIRITPVGAPDRVRNYGVVFSAQQ